MNKVQIYRQTELDRRKYYQLFEKTWFRVLYSENMKLIEKLKANPGMIADIGNHINTDDANIKKAFERSWIETSANFARRSFKRNKKDQSFRYNIKQDEEDYFEWLDDMWTQKTTHYIETFGGNRIRSIDVTNNDLLKRLVKNSIDESKVNGYGAEKAAKNLIEQLRTVGQDMSRNSAIRIARTEIVAASNYGSLIGAQTLGYKMNKVWISAHDERTRNGEFNHDIDEEVPLNDFFKLTGEDLLYPGDPDGSAGNIIQCRCTCSEVIL